MRDRRVLLLIATLLYFVLAGCLAATGDVTPEGQDQSRVVIVVPLDRPFVFSAPGTVTQAGFLHAQVVSVHDGGTLTVLLGGRHAKVRLIGIEAPEQDQSPWGEQAREALKSMVEEKTVRLETDVTKRDQYKRLLAYVYTAEIFVNAEMVRQGQAVLKTVPPNVAHVEEYRKAQMEAREAGRGVWNAAQPLDVAPDCHRKRKKGLEC
jgi:micrococcal nuclease